MLPNTSHHRPRTARLEASVFRLTRLYRRRRAEGRDLAWLIARSNRLTTAYLAAREAELSSPL
jgi:hypothetical protein